MPRRPMRFGAIPTSRQYFFTSARIARRVMGRLANALQRILVRCVKQPLGFLLGQRWCRVLINPRRTHRLNIADCLPVHEPAFAELLVGAANDRECATDRRRRGTFLTAECFLIYTH